jgi:hypothetical protein
MMETMQLNTELGNETWGVALEGQMKSVQHLDPRAFPK